MKKLFITLVVILISFMVLPAQEVSDSLLEDYVDVTIDIFEDLDPMDITLTFDLKHYQRTKNDEEYIPVHFLLQYNDSLQVEYDMRIKARGQFRRAHCSFAPFWLNIRKAEVVNEKLQDVVKMKIVTQCRSGKDYSDYVLKEYLTYKLYNLLSPVSFRVRLVHMTYIDTGRKNKATESWAFMIEPESMLAERNNGMVVKKDELSMRHMKPDEFDLAAMFQYLVGNPDYSIAGRHNMKVVGLPGFGSAGYTPVPYDFDYSGIVNASYAIPGDDLGISSVTERYFLGLCRDDADYQAAIDKIEDHREEMISLVNDFQHLRSKHKEEMIEYIESFFKSAKDSDFIAKKLKSTCR